MRWFRFYDDALNDPKVQRLSATLFRAWVNLLCLASKFGGLLPELYDIAFALRINERQAEETIRQLVELKLIDETDKGFEPHNWHGRQYASDSSAERVRRHRNAKRNVTETSHPPNSNAPDSDTEQIQTQIQNQNRVEETRQEPRAELLPPELIPDPRKAIFDDGLRWLASSTKRDERALRPLVGRWIKARGDPEVAAAMIAAQQAKPVDPIGWIEARLKSNGQRKPSDLDNRRATIDAIDEVVALAEARQRGVGT